MENDVYQFMVVFKMPSVFTEIFTATIPNQRVKVNEFFNEGKLVSYAVSIENSQAWAVFNAQSEAEALDFVKELPLSHFMRYEINPLTFMNLVTTRIPTFSVN